MGSILDSPSLSVERGFLHNNSISFWPTMTILHKCIAYDRRKAPIDFGVKRSKVKFVRWSLHPFRMITPLPFDIQWWCFTHELIMTQGEPLLILGSIGQIRTLLSFDLQWWYLTHVLPVIWGATLLIFGSKVKVKLGKFEFVAAGVICPF